MTSRVRQSERTEPRERGIRFGGNFPVGLHQNPPGMLVACRFPDPTPRNSETIYLGWSPETFTLNLLSRLFCYRWKTNHSLRNALLRDPIEVIFPLSESCLQLLMGVHLVCPVFFISTWGSLWYPCVGEPQKEGQAHIMAWDCQLFTKQLT